MQHGVNALTVWSGVNKLLMSEIENLIFNFKLSVAPHKFVKADLSPRDTLNIAEMLSNPACPLSKLQKQQQTAQPQQQRNAQKKD